MRGGIAEASRIGLRRHAPLLFLRALASRVMRGLQIQILPTLETGQIHHWPADIFKYISP